MAILRLSVDELKRPVLVAITRVHTQLTLNQTTLVSMYSTLEVMHIYTYSGRVLCMSTSY